MLICSFFLFFDRRGIVHKKICSSITNQVFYKDVLESPRKGTIRMGPDIANRCTFVTEFLTFKGIPVVSQPPYSLDLSPCNFFLFFEKSPQGRHFKTSENIQYSGYFQLCCQK